MKTGFVRKGILKPNRVYFIFVYPGADKWASTEVFTVDKEMKESQFMTNWYKKKRIPEGAQVWFHIKEIKNKFKRY